MMHSVTLENMPGLDFRSPFDELSELKEVLKIAEIAELTGLRRETISRARPNSHFRRSTENLLGNLYAVVTQIKATNGSDLGQLGPVLRKPQSLLGDRSMAELLKEGKVDLVLEHLTSPSLSEEEQLEDLVVLSPAAEAELRTMEADGAEEPMGSDLDQARRTHDPVALDAEFARGVEAIEGKIRDQFGSEVTIRREVVTDYSSPVGRTRLYLRIKSGLPFDQELDLLNEVLDSEEALLSPLEDRLTVGNL